MSVNYDQYYKAPNLFGAPYPVLLDFFERQPVRGKVLDVGCGQGRDAIALARMGYEVVGIDHSKVGIEQMNEIAVSKDLSLSGLVADIFEFQNFKSFDFILLDSMLHFAKNDKKQEVELIQSMLIKAKNGCLLVFCLQNTKHKVDMLNHALDSNGALERIAEETFLYKFVDSETGHTSETPYKMIVVRV
ncbi:MAG: hypothetical protein Salg2KO_05460 [Salibacteraceae bacterium]